MNTSPCRLGRSQGTSGSGVVATSSLAAPPTGTWVVRGVAAGVAGGRDAGRFISTEEEGVRGGACRSTADGVRPVPAAGAGRSAEMVATATVARALMPPPEVTRAAPPLAETAGVGRAGGAAARGGEEPLPGSGSGPSGA